VHVWLTRARARVDGIFVTHEAMHFFNTHQHTQESQGFTLTGLPQHQELCEAAWRRVLALLGLRRRHLAVLLVALLVAQVAVAAAEGALARAESATASSFWTALQYARDWTLPRFSIRELILPSSGAFVGSNADASLWESISDDTQETTLPSFDDVLNDGSVVAWHTYSAITRLFGRSTLGSNKLILQGSCA